MRRIFGKVSKFMHSMAEADFSTHITALTILALILNFILEALGRKSVVEAFLYLITSPLGFVLNTLIILFTLTVCLFIKRRTALILLLSVLWLSLGIANSVVLTYRSNPLSAIDFLVIKSMGTMTALYFSVAELILTGIGIIAVVALLVLMVIKCPPGRTFYRKTAATLFVILLTAGLLNLATVMTKDMEYKTGEVKEAYEDLGFVYCFTNSIISHGVDRPDGYEEIRPEEIIEELTAADTSLDNSPPTFPDVLPNIVILQLESFIDPSEIKGIEFSEAPTPNFAKLKNDGVSGYLRVPHVGGGTANVEFEVLTGMNLDHFGFGEYPYTTALRATACESLAANLKSVGYGTHAMHNHIASFYDRDIAYASLGFDTFTPIEMMTNITRNPLGWAKDSILTNEIVSALDMTETPDFVFAVSVQGHGKYPEEPIDTADNVFGASYRADAAADKSSDDIEVYNISDEAVRSQVTYYANQIHEMDAVIGEIITALEARGEPYVLAVYGDHLPALPVDEGDLVSADLYASEYAITANIPFSLLSDGGSINGLDRDLEAYMLAAYIQQLCGFAVGDITALHQYELDSGEDCDEILQNLEYEQLYDDETIEYEPTNMRFGTRDITFSSYTRSGNKLYIKGSGFNEYSVVKIDGIKRSTKLVDSTALTVENIYFDIKEIEVVQVADNGEELSRAVQK